jgi:putative transcription antitermination factor YqgF
MILLGIDFGLKKIGLALAQDDLIQFLGVIRNSPKVFEEIGEICRKNEVEKIVIGLTTGPLFSKTKKFASQLSSEIGLPVEFQDETLTSRQAIVKMVEEGIRKKKRKKLEDAAAAACILKEYLLRKEVKSV